MSKDTDYIKTIDIKMDKEISPTFCMAKWHHTSIYLHTGQTHSCYHPRPHAISKDEIKNNPSALHNTVIKKAERQEMLLGKKPDGCTYCWNVESLGDTHISDRQIRNASIYTPERFQEILDKPHDFNINPEYIEVAFSNECNFKCGYCHPMSSSSFFQEIKKHGPYDMVQNHRLDIDWFKAHEEGDNPYVEAWWKWWPEVSKTLNILRVTGGEPLMHKSTWRLFDELRENPKPALELNVNSNLGITTRFVEKLVDNVVDLLENKKIKKFKLFSSMDTWGKRAEYLRTGLDLELWEKNLDTFVRGTKTHVTFMCTFNILSVTSYISFLEKVLEWRAKYDDVINVLNLDNPTDRKIRFDTPYLKEPLQYDMHILPKEEYLPHFDAILKFIKDNTVEDDVTKFSELEYEKFRRVRDYFATVQYPEARVKEGRIDFYNWFTEYDRRRDLNFLETFPDMENFWNTCKTLAEEKINGA
jgi:organic radical activating enzyme